MGFKLTRSINFMEFDLPYIHKTNNLSTRELEIVKLICAGLRDKIIASKLFISIGTLNTHKQNIFRKLNIQSKFELLTGEYQRNNKRSTRVAVKD